MAERKKAPTTSYLISIRGEIPLDVVARVSFLHASAMLEKVYVAEDPSSTRKPNSSHPLSNS